MCWPINNTRGRVLGDDNVSVLADDHPAAVVNGLTSDKRDAWTMGYTTQLVVGVHLNREDDAAMSLDPLDTQGSAPVWRAVLDYLNQRDNLPPQSWERPDNIVDLAVCDRSGLLPNDVCPTHREIFISGIQPTRVDTYWQEVDVNDQTNQLATVNTPAGSRSQRVYFVPAAGSDGLVADQ